MQKYKVVVIMELQLSGHIGPTIILMPVKRNNGVGG